MHPSQRKRLSQNFFHSRKLVASLVGNSSIRKNDLVIEIGPGKGIITEQLIMRAGQVVAIEVDDLWYHFLKNKFAAINNFTIYCQDFLTWALPRSPYKVFANIPFAIEGKIIRRLIDASNPPNDCYLVMMKELAYRLAAPYKENQFSVTHKPWFDFSIYWNFHPTDFTPVPSVAAAMLRFTLKHNPLLPVPERTKYQQFITRGFGQGLPVRQNLRQYYTRAAIDGAFHELSLDKNARPGHLSLEQWISLYKALRLAT
jgi:23S rRNA (adenine-N6)-dimethyltransferase